MPRNQLFINNKDAYTTWGISMTNEALSALMSPPALKDWITNEMRTEDGTEYVQGAYVPKLKERTFILPISLTAPDETTFHSRYASFCEELASGVLVIRTEFQPTIYYRCVYNSCSQFTQFARQMATFGLSLTEPDPSNRSV